jgi:hypothetical protein
MTDRPQHAIRSDDRFLTIAEYCERFRRSRASFYRDRAAGLVHVVMLGRSPRIVERLTLERLIRVDDSEAA